MAARADTDLVMQKTAQRSRQVWIALVVSMAAFLTLCGVSGWGIFGFLGGLTDTRPATVQLLSASGLFVQKHTSTQQELVTGSATLQEGDIATTNKDGNAFISLFNDSGTIQMYFNSSVEIDTLRTTRFFQNNREMAITVHNGTIQMVTSALSDNTSASYTVSTEQAEIEVEPGSTLRVEVEGEQETKMTQVVVNAGRATLRSHGAKIDLLPEQMAWVSGNGLPEGPAPAQKNLINNGTFEELPTSNSEEISEGGLGTRAWLPLPNEGSAAGSPASVEITSEVNLQAAVITGEGGQNHYVRVGMTQDINEPASFFNSIELSATIKLVNQALPAGGPVEDVYPLIIRIVYTDQFGKNHDWKRSFYFVGPTPDPNIPATIKITQGRWTTTHEIEAARGAAKPGSVVTDGLFVLKSPSQAQDIAVINTIEVYGYGTEFTSWITNISLMAR